MKSFVVVTVSAVLGSVLASVGASIAAPVAEAAPKAPLQSLSCRAGKAKFKDNTYTVQGVPLARLEKQMANTFLRVNAERSKSGKNGTGSTGILSLVVFGLSDPRLPVEYPVTFAAGGQGSFVGGSYTQTVTKDVEKGPGVTLEATTTSWTIDQTGSPAFRLDLLKWDAATLRITGKFSGTMRPADGAPVGQKNLSIKSGKFVAVMQSTGGI